MSHPIVIASVAVAILVIGGLVFGVTMLLQGPGSSSMATSTDENGIVTLPVDASNPLRNDASQSAASGTDASSTFTLRPFRQTPTATTPGIVIKKPPVPPPVTVPPPPPVVEETLSPDAVPPAGFTWSQLSPYYQKIHISGFQIAQSPGDPTSFSIQVDTLVKPVDITRWRLQTNRGMIYIPHGVVFYDPYGLSKDRDIFLSSGEHMVVYGTGNPNPLAKNYRINRCMGFLNTLYDPSPQIPEQCPEMYSRDELVTLNGMCQEYIFQFSGCRTPTVDDINNAPFQVSKDATCRAFLDRFNYRACYDRYNNIDDFLTPEWRVWIDAQIPFDAFHDRVLFFDTKGLLVDYYVY